MTDYEILSQKKVKNCGRCFWYDEVFDKCLKRKSTKTLEASGGRCKEWKESET